jgi:hypothetical protein
MRRNVFLVDPHFVLIVDSPCGLPTWTLRTPDFAVLLLGRGTLVLLITTSYSPLDLMTDRRFRCASNANRWLSSRKDLSKRSPGESGDVFTGMLLPGTKISSFDFANEQIGTRVLRVGTTKLASVTESNPASSSVMCPSSTSHTTRCSFH